MTARFLIPPPSPTMSSPPGAAPDARLVPLRPTVRTDVRDDLDNAAAPADPNWRPMPGGINPAMINVIAAQQQQQQRASLSSMLFLTFFFFMMSGGNGGNRTDLIDVQNRGEQPGKCCSRRPC